MRSGPMDRAKVGASWYHFMLSIEVWSRSCALAFSSRFQSAWPSCAVELMVAVVQQRSLVLDLHFSNSPCSLLRSFHQDLLSKLLGTPADCRTLQPNMCLNQFSCDSKSQLWPWGSGSCLAGLGRTTPPQGYIHKHRNVTTVHQCVRFFSLCVWFKLVSFEHFIPIQLDPIDSSEPAG